MTKLIIQIPCFNEEETLAVTLLALPKSLPGVDEIEWMIIDDGSTDRTVEVALCHGVEHIVQLKKNQGLAKAFMSGLRQSILLGADIIVNTDADNQYCAQDIDKLIQPILDGRYDIVIGERPIAQIQHFSPIKKLLQFLGSWVVRQISGTRIPDATSGFRAMSRSAAKQLNVFNSYTYTLETIIQAGHKNIPITFVPIRVNGDLRPSRLVKSIPSYIQRSILTMFRIFIVYRPLRFFTTLSSVFFLGGFVIASRFLYFYLQGAGSGHIQSLLLSSVLILVSFILLVSGIIADLIAVNRNLLEQQKLQLYYLEEALQAKTFSQFEKGAETGVDPVIRL